MKWPLYIYWEGTPKPYYEACIRTILHHNPDATVIGREAAVAIIGKLPPAVEATYVVHRVDWIRKRLVYETGGMYVDADFICLQSLDALRQLAAEFDYVGYREWNGSGTWMDNFFAARKGSPVLRDAANHALAQMIEWGQDVPWLATNAQAIAPAVERHQWRKILQIPTHLINPVSVTQPWWFTAEEPTDLGAYSCFGFMTSYHGVGGWVGAKTVEDLLASESRIGQLLRRAMA